MFECLDLLLSRYNSYVMDLGIGDGLELIKTAYLKQIEERLWQQWLVERPYMETFISFEDYKKKAFKSVNKDGSGNVDTKKIIEEAEKIKKLDQGGGNN